MTEEKQYTVRLESIHLSEKFLKNIKEEFIEYQFEVTFSKIVKELDNIKLITRVTVMPKDSNEKLAGITVFFEYQATGLRDVEDIPQDFNHTLKSLSIGTVRGILFSEFRGTNLHNAILPAMDISKFD